MKARIEKETMDHTKKYTITISYTNVGLDSRKKVSSNAQTYTDITYREACSIYEQMINSCAMKLLADYSVSKLLPLIDPKTVVTEDPNHWYLYHPDIKVCEDKTYPPHRIFPKFYFDYPDINPVDSVLAMIYLQSPNMNQATVSIRCQDIESNKEECTHGGEEDQES